MSESLEATCDCPPWKHRLGQDVLDAIFEASPDRDDHDAAWREAESILNKVLDERLLVPGEVIDTLRSMALKWLDLGDANGTPGERARFDAAHELLTALPPGRCTNCYEALGGCEKYPVHVTGLQAQMYRCALKPYGKYVATTVAGREAEIAARQSAPKEKR